MVVTFDKKSFALYKLEL